VSNSGTADLNIVGLGWSFPPVGYGLGDSALDHIPEERISLDEVSLSTCVLVHVARTVTRAALSDVPSTSLIGGRPISLPPHNVAEERIREVQHSPRQWRVSLSVRKRPRRL